MDIIVYTKSGCPWCADIINFLHKNHLEFEEKEVRSNRTHYDELIRISGQNKTPTLIIDEEVLPDSDCHQVLHFFNRKGIKVEGC